MTSPTKHKISNQRINQTINRIIEIYEKEGNMTYPEMKKLMKIEILKLLVYQRKVRFR